MTTGIHCTLFTHAVPAILSDEATELAYVAPSVMIKQRKRGLSKETQEDQLVISAIKSGKTPKQLDVIRTKRQKDLFEEFKKGKMANMLHTHRYDNKSG